MALTATVFSFAVELADVDRGVYETIELKVAQHPSETAEYMLVRVMAYCLEYAEGIEMTRGLSTTDEPALWVRDATGRITTWIEVGAPAAERLHKASKLCDRVVVYTHKDLRQYLPQLAGQRIHKREEIMVHAFDRAFIDGIVPLLERRMKMSLSVTERHLYAEANGTTFTCELLPVSIPDE
ncbi:MAG: YaeQ family protein [Acidobacteria bacterium]|nr:YaeQ family protein [Acidobacteriota bacterium]